VGTKEWREIGLKITSSQREYYRYTDVSAEVQRHRLHTWPRLDFTRISAREQRQAEDRPDLEAGTSTIEQGFS
jgi:hypothetical protein